MNVLEDGYSCKALRTASHLNRSQWIGRDNRVMYSCIRVPVHAYVLADSGMRRGPEEPPNNTSTYF